MGRNVVVAVLVAAALVGAGLGVVLHATWPDPFSRTSVTPQPSSPTQQATVAPGSSPSPSPSPRRSAKPAPTPTSASPSPAPSQEPAFTRLALLQPKNFLDRGWGTARQIDEFDQLPSTAITPCTTVPSSQPGLRAGFAATYASERSGAAEIVARFDQTQQAESAFDSLRAAVAGCADSSTAPDRVRITDTHHPQSDAVSEVRWWNTRPLESGSARGVIGLVRVDDRVALISLRSDVSDPAETTEISSLLVEAGKRLV